MGNTKTEKRNHDLWQFDDVNEFIDYAESHWPKGYPQNGTRRDDLPSAEAEHTGYDGTGWYGSDSYEHACELAREGWQHGLTVLSDLLDQTAPYVIAALNREHGQGLAPAGYMPDVPSFCAGSPACMYTEGEDIRGRTPVVRLLVSCSAMGQVGSSARMNRGAAICAVIDYLEQVGLTVEVEAVMCAIKSSKLHECYVPIKKAGDPLDTDRMAFYLANPSFHRRFGFRLREMVWGGSSGMGSSRDVTPDPDQIYFKCLHTGDGYETPERAMHTVLKHLAEQLDGDAAHKISEDWEDFLAETDSRAWM